MNIWITKHAVDRALERFGWDTHKLFNQAIKSLNDGLYVLDDETLYPMFIESATYGGGLPYMYEGVVFVFDEDRLITVYPISGRGLNK